MNDSWKSAPQWKRKRIEETLAPLAEKVAQWDDEIMAAHVHMARIMVDRGSYQSLTAWMKSEERDAQEFRKWTNESGFRFIIARLYANLENRNIEELKAILHEG